MVDFAKDRPKLKHGMHVAKCGGFNMNDLKFAFRQLLKNPGFTAVAALTLALGIGANTVVFSVAKALLFRPLGFAAPDRLMWVRLSNTQTGSTEDRLSSRDIEDIRESARSFESLALVGSPGATWEDDDRSDEVSALRVTPNLADALGLRAALGRLFLQSDSAAGDEPHRVEVSQSPNGREQGAHQIHPRHQRHGHVAKGMLCVTAEDSRSLLDRRVDLLQGCHRHTNRRCGERRTERQPSQ
jgi:hypothetical protein